jgi:hypothetical protein
MATSVVTSFGIDILSRVGYVHARKEGDPEEDGIDAI